MIRIALGATLLAAAATAVLLAALPAPAAPGPQPPVLVAATAPSADLPGVTGAAQFTVRNDNPFAVRLLALEFGRGPLIGAAGVPAVPAHHPRSPTV